MVPIYPWFNSYLPFLGMVLFENGLETMENKIYIKLHQTWPKIFVESVLIKLFLITHGLQCQKLTEFWGFLWHQSNLYHGVLSLLVKCFQVLIWRQQFWFLHCTNPCQISLAWWRLLRRGIGKMENPKSYLKRFWRGGSCVIRNSCKDKSCSRNTLSQKSHEAVFIYHEFKDTYTFKDN